MTLSILHFYKTSLPETMGGVETFIDSLCKSTAAMGINNTVLSLAKKPSKEPIHLSGYRITQVKQDFFIASTGFSLAAFKKYRELARQADIIHLHFPNPFADILYFSCRVKKPTIVTYHSDIVKQKNLMKIYSSLMNRFLNSVNKIIATSPNYLTNSETLQKFSHKVEIIPIGIDKESYPKLNVERVSYWKSRLPKNFFLFVGALRYYKGLHIALQAAEPYTLVIAGSGPMQGELAQAAGKNVYFLDQVTEEDKVALIHLCYSFIFPSHLPSEAFGISLLEAAMYGKPLISCEIGTGTSFVNINQETGLVVEANSPESLRQAMQFMLDNPEKAQEFGRNAEKRYWQYFSIQHQTEKYLKLYYQLIK